MEYGLYTNAGPKTVQFSLWWQQVLAERDVNLKVTGYLGGLLQNAGLEHQAFRSKGMVVELVVSALGRSVVR